MRLDLWKWTQCVCICLCFMLIPIREHFPEKKQLNNQVDRKTCPMDISQPLSLATSMNNDHSGRGIVMWAQSQGSRSLKFIQLLPTSQEQRTTLSSHYDTILRGGQSTTWWQVDFIRLNLRRGRRNSFFMNGHLLCIWICFLHLQSHY